MAIQQQTCVVTGASGLLGRAVLQCFLDAGYKVAGLAYSRADKNPQYVKCDLNNSEQLTDTFRKYEPDIVVHCAAERRPEVVDHQTSRAETLNVECSERVAELCKQHNAFLVYISTDYVFDGTNPPYKEDAAPNPLNTYGKLKLMGEKAVLAVHAEKTVVLRVPILYGPIEYLDESAVTTLFEKLLEAKRTQNSTCKPAVMNHYETRYPTHVKDVASASKFLVEASMKGANVTAVNGIFHWGNSEEPLTKYEMVSIMASVFDMPMDNVKADATPSTGASRPKDARLDCKKLKTMGFVQNTPFREGIREVLLPFLE